MSKQAANIPPNQLIDELERLAAPGLVASMDAGTLGAFVRLVAFAWKQEPPCSLPADEAMLAFVSRTHEWDRVRPALLVAFVPSTDHPGRLINSHARAVYDALAAEVAAFSEKQSRASRARWGAKEAPSHPTGMPVGSHRDASGMPPASSRASAPSLRSESLEAPALKRSIPSTESMRSAERTEERGEVIGMVGAGARAREIQLALEWRATQCKRLAEAAIERWRREGICEAPASKAVEISRAEGMKPAIVATAIQKVDDKQSAEKRAGGKLKNAYGLFVTYLGLSAGSARRGPVEPLLHIATEWADKLEKVMPLIRAQAAIDLRREQPNESSTAQAGGA